MTRDEVKTAFSTHTSGTWLQCLKQPHPSIQFGYLMACVLNKVILHCQRVVVPKASILKHEIKAADLLRIDLTFAYSYGLHYSQNRPRFKKKISISKRWEGEMSERPFLESLSDIFKDSNKLNYCKVSRKHSSLGTDFLRPWTWHAVYQWTS